MPPRQRPEPTLGQFDAIAAEQLVQDPRRRPSGASRQGRLGRPGPGGREEGRRLSHRQAARRRRRLAMGAGVVAMLLALLVWWQQDWLRQQVSGSQTASLVAAAARAEAEGRWHGSDDGEDALGLYRRILAGDADSEVARLGLRRVAAQLDEQAGSAIDAGALAQAQALIAELSELGWPAGQIAALEARLEKAQADQAGLQALLASGRQALAEGQLDGSDGALAIFRRMLAADPANALARQGLEDAQAARLQQARSQAAAGEFDRARAGIDVVAQHSPQHAGLPAARQALAQAEQARKQAQQEAEHLAREPAGQTPAAAERAAALAAAEADLKAGRLEAAQEGYQRLLAAQPEDADARRGLARVAAAWLARADAAIADGDTDGGRQLLERAHRAGASQARLAPLQERLEILGDRLATVLARPELDAGQQQRLDALLDRAREADLAGRLVEPAGDSAYDLYRQVLAIDPMHEEARHGVNALPRRAQALASHHMELGQLEQAGRALEALQAMAPMSPSLPELARQLASAWLASGERALAAGDIARARQALARARTLAPAHPGLATLSSRLAEQ